MYNRVSGCKYMKWRGCGSFLSHLHLIVKYNAAGTSRLMAAYFLYRGQEKQTDVKAEARKIFSVAQPKGKSSICQKHKHRGPPNPQVSTSDNHPPFKYTTIIAPLAFTTIQKLFLSHQWFVKETHILANHKPNTPYVMILQSFTN